MTFNLISDIWIPVVMKNGEKRVIRPADIADPEIERIEGRRPDMTAACLEFLIGLVALVAPPRDLSDWTARRGQRPSRFTSKLNALAPAFNLIGNGPLFMQDFENIGDMDLSPVHTLFPDGKSDAKIRREKDLGYPRAAMALFQMQMHPGGDLRQSGRMVTIVDTGAGLWDTIWANVPYGAPMDPSRMTDLPWMHPVAAGRSPGACGMFRMSRKLQLRHVGNRATGVYDKGTYGAPLICTGPLVPTAPAGTVTTEGRPRRIASDRFGIDHWAGTVLPEMECDTRADCVRLQSERRPGESSVLHVYGWHVPNVKAPTFLDARVALHQIDAAGQALLRNIVGATGLVGMSLRKALFQARGSVAGLDPAGMLVEATAQNVVRLALDLRRGSGHRLIASAYHTVLRNEAMRIFQDLAVPRRVTLTTEDAARIDAARQKLVTLFDTNRANARALREALGLLDDVQAHSGDRVVA